jgi:acetyltransferase-like isoleucine patch superfamily enzyme
MAAAAGASRVRLAAFWLRKGGPKGLWTYFWMQLSGTGSAGRLASRLAAWFAPPHRQRTHLADMAPQGYVAASAVVRHSEFHRGANVFVGERVVVFQNEGGGPVEIGDRAQIFPETVIETGDGGSLAVGADTFIMPRCQLLALKAPIRIGSHVQIAQECAFYPYQHGIQMGELIVKQPLTTRGGIEIGDDAWLGHGTVVMSGVRIGTGAVIGARSVVMHDVPDYAIAMGAPARVVGMRE